MPLVVLVRLQLQAQSVADFGHQLWWDVSNDGAEAFDSDRANLFGLCLRVAAQAGWPRPTAASGAQRFA